MITSPPLTAVIVDDEPLARRELRGMLAAHPELRVIGEAEDVEEATTLMQAASPDVLFLDIQLAGATGFDLLARLTADFEVIFVTAYEEHALRAFEVNALGYLLKPVQRERLADVVARLLKRAPDDAGASDAMAPPLAYDDRLFVRLSDRWTFISVSAIQSIVAEGNYSRLTTIDGRSTLVSRTLKGWMARLPVRRFLRIHRSAVINLAQVERVEEWSASSYQVFLRNATQPLTMSRRYAARIQERLG